MKNLFLLFTIAALLVSCNNEDHKNPGISQPGFSGRWELEHMPGYSQTVELLYTSGKPWLNIDSSAGTFTGFTGCNTMSGSIEVPDSIRIQITKEKTTEKACAGDAEAAFLHALAQVQFFHWQGPDSLWLLRENRVVLRFVRKM